jgi:hypothetical protein
VAGQLLARERGDCHLYGCVCAGVHCAVIDCVACAAWQSVARQPPSPLCHGDGHGWALLQPPPWPRPWPVRGHEEQPVHFSVDIWVILV